MKRALSAMIAAVIAVMTAITAVHAFTFSDAIDFGGNGSLYHATYKYIQGSRYDDPFQYTHTFSAPAGMILKTASLSITHIGNATTHLLFFLKNPSNWEVTGEGFALDTLSRSPLANGWVTDTFDLTGILNRITDTTPWSLTVSLQNTTSWDDVLKLDKSVFSGTYEAAGNTTCQSNEMPVPAPEPATMMLIGSGALAGLGAASFRRRS